MRTWKEILKCGHLENGTVTAQKFVIKCTKSNVSVGTISSIGVDDKLHKLNVPKLYIKTNGITKSRHG